MRAHFVHQLADAVALIAELPDDSPDGEAACQWLTDARKSIERVDAMLGNGNGEKVVE